MVLKETSPITDTRHSVTVRRLLQLRFYCDSTALRPPLDDLRHDGAAALRPKYINRSVWLRLAVYVPVTLITFDKQSNGRRIEVETAA